MTTADPLAAVRARLKGAPKSPTPSKAPSSDPLATVRAQVKAGRATKNVSTGLLPILKSTEGRLAALEAVVNALASVRVGSMPAELTAALSQIAQRDWTQAL